MTDRQTNSTTDVIFLYFSGTALEELKCFDKAIEEFRAAEKIFPDNQNIKFQIERIESLLIDDSTDLDSD